MQWCHDHGVLYVNTSVELWDPYAGAEQQAPDRADALLAAHEPAAHDRRLDASPGPTAVLEHGANPGLITHFTKQGLLDIAEQALADEKFAGAAGREDRRTTPRRRSSTTWPTKLGVKVIHCSERDTQITDQPKEVDEFVNTWSVEGFREEGTTTAEMGWGTHEKELPALAFEHPDGPQEPDLPGAHGHQHLGRQLGAADYHIVGMVVRHGEAFTITEKLTVWEDGKAVYRPTVHYAYCPCDSRHRLAARAARPRLRAAAAHPHHDRRDHQRRRHPGRAGHGPPVSSRGGPARDLEHRGVAAARAAPERHHDAGGHLGGRRRACG